jgi:hypothetical protein
MILVQKSMTVLRSEKPSRSEGKKASKINGNNLK